MNNDDITELKKLIESIIVSYKEYVNKRNLLFDKYNDADQINRLLVYGNKQNAYFIDKLNNIKLYNDEYKKIVENINEKINEFIKYQIKYQEKISNELSNLIDEINKCKFEFNSEEIEELIILLKKLNFYYKNSLVMNKITKNDYSLINRIFGMRQIPRLNQIKIIEKLRIHNTLIDYKISDKFIDKSKLYKTFDAINLGGISKKIINISTDRRKNVDNYINDFKIQLKNNANYNAIEYLLISFDENTGSFSRKLSREEVEYYYECILDYINDLILENKKILMEYDEKDPSSFDSNFYLNNSTKNEIIDNIYDLINIYKRVFNVYENNLFMYDEFMQKKNDINLGDDKINEVYYLATPSYDENQRTYVEKDLKSIPNDLYGKIKYYLQLLSIADIYEKERTNPKFEGTEVLGGVHKIKDDQLRIIYEHLGENKIGVKGIFIKKKGFERELYANVASRDAKYVSADEVEEHLFDFLEENKHKGGRGSI